VRVAVFVCVFIGATVLMKLDAVFSLYYATDFYRYYNIYRYAILCYYIYMKKLNAFLLEKEDNCKQIGTITI